MKTVKFEKPKYVGDPINAVKIFNEKEADELMVVDIDATRTGTKPNYALIEKLAAECRMPLCYGGGVSTVEEAKRIIGLGVEKVALSAAAVAAPSVLTKIAESVGRQSVVAVLDVKRKSRLFGKEFEVYTHNATKPTGHQLIALAKTLAEAGAGEIVVNCIERDGVMDLGYDIEIAKSMRAAVSVPLTMLGGAGTLDHLAELFDECGVIGAAAGSLFVFKGKFRAVLISYPSQEQKDKLYLSSIRKQ